jgi:hopanoid biosynthesis associated protein HpnK
LLKLRRSRQPQSHRCFVKRRDFVKPISRQCEALERVTARPESNSAATLLDWRVRRLIVNADDFGLTIGVNRAIVEAHTQGIVTSATLMANSSAFFDAIQIAPASLSVGCHVVLMDGHPVLNPRDIPSLTNTGGEEFEREVTRFGLRALRGRIAADEVEAEAAAQMRKLQAAGVHVSHLDSHKHAHIFPQILRPLLCAAKTCGVRAIRNPYGKVGWSMIASRPRLWKRYWETGALRVFAEKFRRAVSEAGLFTPDGTLGIVLTGALDERVFHLVLESIPEGTWELVCHPGYQDADLDKIRTRLRQSREVELRLLTSAAAQQILRKNEIRLISYREL